MKRRDFLKTMLTGAAGFTFSGLTFMPPRRTHAATGVVNVTFVAEGAFKTMIDGTDIYVWQFREIPDGSGPGELTSGLLAQEGDTVNVRIVNELGTSIKFFIPGVSENSPVVLPGNSLEYSFTAPAAGSYMYYDNNNGKIGRAMGLSGPLIVMPSDGSSSLYGNGPAFDGQYTLVLNELDSRLNESIYTGQSFDVADYEPNYFFVNGLSYPDTGYDEDTLVTMNVGEEVAIRFINTGMIASPMHFHGYHVKVASRNRVVETSVIDKDTVFVSVGECVDVILPVTQPGIYPVHTHFVPGVTSNGTYLNPYGGALVVMRAT